MTSLWSAAQLAALRMVGYGDGLRVARVLPKINTIARSKKWLSAFTKYICSFTSKCMLWRYKYRHRRMSRYAISLACLMKSCRFRVWLPHFKFWLFYFERLRHKWQPTAWLQDIRKAPREWVYPWSGCRHIKAAGIVYDTLYRFTSIEKQFAISLTEPKIAHNEIS